MVSCGMDNIIKIWFLRDYWKFVEMLFIWIDFLLKFFIKYVQFLVFNVLVYSNYVDCMCWFGDFILFKSVDNEIVLWELLFKVFGMIGNEGKVDVL